MRITLLGVPIDALTRTEAAQKAAALLKEPGGHLVTTPNPEMLVLATREAWFREALQRSALAIPDGVGLLYVASCKGRRLPERVSGTDFVDDLCGLAVCEQKSVFLLGGGSPDVAQRTAAVLQKRHAGLRVAGAENGGKVQRRSDGSWEMDAMLLDRVRAASPDILLVAFGHGKQERWIVDHLSSLPSVKLAIGIGGAFDFIAGDVRRAPAWLRAIGLEWLWRLVAQPWRWHRIWTAVFVFPWLAFTRKD